MNPKTTLIFGGIFVFVFGTLAVLKVIDAPTEAEKRAAEGRVVPELFNVDAESVTKVTLSRDKESFEFEYSADDDRWKMNKPLEVLAQSSAVRDLFNDVKNLSRRPTGSGKDDKAGVIEPKLATDLVQYGLDSPATAITLTYKPRADAPETSSVTLQVGAATADKDGLYVKLASDKFVFVVNKSSLRSIEKKTGEFRQAKLVTVSRWDTDRVQLVWPDRKLSAEKKDTKWRLIEPIADRADSNKIEELIGKLGDLKADADADYIDDAATDLAKYGLDAPQLVAEVRKPGSDMKEDRDKKKDSNKEKSKAKPTIVERVLIGKPVDGREDRVYAKLADQKYVVAVAASLLGDIQKQPNDLRSRDLVELTRGDVDYVRVQRSAGTVAVGKKDNAWEILEPKKVSAESAAVDDLVKKIDELEIKEFIDGGDASEHGLSEPSIAVALYQKGLKADGQNKDSDSKTRKADKKDEKNEETKSDVFSEPKGEPIRITFGKQDEEKKLIYVRRGDEPTIFAVSTEGLMELVDRDYLAYRNRRVLSFPEIDVAKLSVYREGKTFAAERKKETEGDTKEIWRLTEPLDAPADTTTISDILFGMRLLNAKKFFAEDAAELAPYGLDQPQVRATVTLKATGDEEPKQHVLLIGDEAEGGGNYAKLGSDNLIFAVEPTLVNYLKGELHDRSLLRLDSAKVEGLVLTWPDAKLELANRKPEGKPTKEWSVVGDESFKLDTKKPGELVNYLAFLSAESFAQYQGDFAEAYGLEQPALLIEVKLEGERTAKTLRIGGAAEDAKRYAAVGEKSGPVAILSDTRIKDYLTGPNHFALAEEKKPEPEKPADDPQKNDKPDAAKESSKPETKPDEPNAESK